MIALNRQYDWRSSHWTLVKGAIWTVGAAGIGSLLRFASSIVLARLLAPELFGVMVIVYSLRTGFELTSDIGIGQNLIYSKNSEDPDFYNTAWSLQIIRGLLLWLVCSILAIPLARFYQSPILTSVIPVAAIVCVLMGFSSASVFLIRKRLRLVRLNLFDIALAFSNTAVQIAIAYVIPTIWALVGGNIIGAALGTIGSYFLLPDVRQRFVISKKYAWEILTFGKWIYLASFVYFCSLHFDRLYLAKVIPLALLGVYGIARNISELLSSLILRLGGVVVFPFIASKSHVPRDELREQLASIRIRFLLITAIGLSFLASTADILINVLYDQRYQEAGWMVSILIVGAWFSILSDLNQTTLLGFGKPLYGALGNTFKFVFMVVGLTLSVTKYGVLGAVVVVSVGDLFRYIPIYVGQIRERFSFGAQDFFATVFVFSLIGFWEYLRIYFGFGFSFDLNQYVR